LSINLVLELVLLDGEDFLVCEEDVLVPVVGVPLGGDALLLSIASHSKQE